MASKVESKASSASPAGATSESVPGSLDALRRALSVTTPKFPSSVTEAINIKRGGPPQPLISERQFYGEQRAKAQEAYYGMEPFKPGEFSQKRPEFTMKNVTKAMPLLLVMSTLGGKRTKGNALGMMKAMTAGMKGLQEGNDRGYKQALYDYEANFKEFQQREEVRRQQYDLLREAKKDGLQLAITRAADADKNLDDWNKETSDNLRTMISLAEARDRMSRAATKSPKQAYAALRAKDQDTLNNAAVQYKDLEKAAKAASATGFMTTAEFAFANFFPQLQTIKEFGTLKAGDFEGFKAALNRAVTRNQIADIIRNNAGLSQTAQEMLNQIQSVGVGGAVSAQRFLQMRSKIAEDMDLFSRNSSDHEAAIVNKFLKTSEDLIAESRADEQEMLENNRAYAERHTQIPDGKGITEAQYKSLILQKGYTPKRIRDELGYFVFKTR